jgi:hypothetical protein
MAGAGYKAFAAGGTVLSNDMNLYLIQQMIMTFAGTAARDSALSGVVAAGMVAHVGGGTLTVYNGTAWSTL